MKARAMEGNTGGGDGVQEQSCVVLVGHSGLRAGGVQSRAAHTLQLRDAVLHLLLGLPGGWASRCLLLGQQRAHMLLRGLHLHLCLL